VHSAIENHRAARGTTACKDALTPYRTAKQAAKDAAARKAREEAEARQKAAQEALRQSDDLEAKFAAEQEIEAAQKLVAVANKIDRSATGLRTSWSHRIVNRKELLLHVLDRYPEDLADMLNEFVRRQVASGLRVMPGVEILEEKRAA
jgi:tRNA A37 N6-isopentenylltransferase MiaA